MNRHEVADAGRLVNGRAGEEKYANTIVQVRPVARDDPAGTTAHRKFILSKLSSFGHRNFASPLVSASFLYNLASIFPSDASNRNAPIQGPRMDALDRFERASGGAVTLAPQGKPFLFNGLPMASGCLFPKPARDFC
jgi:hypothetical protein